MKTRPTYTVKRKGDDYEVKMSNVTVTFNMKDTVMNLMAAEKQMREAESQLSVNRSVIENIKTHHKDVYSYFTKLPKIKQTALVTLVQLLGDEKLELHAQDARRVYKKYAKQLADIRKAIPAKEFARLKKLEKK